MQKTQDSKETKRIEAYAIADFVKQIEDCILQGFRLNLEDNEKYPLQIGVGFYCTVDKVQDTTLFVPVFEKEGKEIYFPNETTIFVGSVTNEQKEVNVSNNGTLSTISAAERTSIIQDVIKATAPIAQPSKPGRKPKG